MVEDCYHSYYLLPLCRSADRRLCLSVPLSEAAAAPPSGDTCRPLLPLCPADTRGPEPQPGPGSSPHPLWPPGPPPQPVSTTWPSAGSGTASASAGGRAEMFAVEMLLGNRGLPLFGGVT